MHVVGAPAGGGHNGAIGPVVGGPPVNERLRARDQDEVGDLSLHLLALLAQTGRSRTWLAATDDGVLHVARRLPEQADPEREVLTNDLLPTIGFRGPGLLAATQLWTERETWVIRQFAEGVSLRRLLGVARLTPVQVGAIARDVLASLAVLHEAGIVHGAVHPGNVIVSLGGEACLSDAAQRTNGRARASACQDLDDLCQVVRVALSTADPRQRPLRSTAAHGRLASAIERVLLDGGRRPAPARVGARSAASLLRQLDAVAGEVRLATRKQLGALVERLPSRMLG